MPISMNRPVEDLVHGWLRIAGVDFIENPEGTEPHVALPYYRVPMGVYSAAYSLADRTVSKKGGETPVLLSGFVLLEEGVQEAKALHFRSGHVKGRLQAKHPRAVMLRRFGGESKVEDFLTV